MRKLMKRRLFLYATGKSEYSRYAAYATACSID
jgi:hypothetical protein